MMKIKACCCSLVVTTPAQGSDKATVQFQDWSANLSIVSTLQD